MTATSAVGAAIIVAVALAYVLWIRGQMRAPLPDEPHAFDPASGVRFLGTARVDGKVAGWPRGQLIADREVIMVRVPLGRNEHADLVLQRGQVRSIEVQGSPLSRRVAFVTSGGDQQRVANMKFGAALSDPVPALRTLGWPVGS